MTLHFRTTTRSGLVAFGLAAFAAQGVRAETVATVFNTGQATNMPSTLEAADTTDLHYTVAFQGTAPPTSAAAAGFVSAIVVDPSTFPGAAPYAQNYVTSEYIAPSTSVVSTGVGANRYNNPTGYYDYRTTFDLTGFQASTASLTGGVSADNMLVGIYVNGVAQMFPGNVELSSITPFTLASDFNGGVNTLDFIVQNFDDGPGLVVGSLPTNINASAFRVDGLTLTATAVPEPGSVALLIGVTMTGGGFLSRRRRARK